MAEMLRRADDGPKDGPSLQTYVETRFNLLTESLKQQVDAQHADWVARDLRYQQRFEAQSDALAAAFLSQQTAMQTAFVVAEKAVQAALAAADRAVSKAELAADKRFESVNEFRATLADQQRTFIPRAEVEVMRTALAERVSELKERVDNVLSERKGLVGGWGYAVGAIGFLLAIWAWITVWLK